MFFVVAGSSPASAADADPIVCERDETRPFGLTLMHTNDLHSSFVGAANNAYFTEPTGDADPVRGHYARLAELIRATRAQKTADGEPSLLIDAGDFFGGTLFHILGPNPELAYVPELDFFAYAGYDAVTLGNHEFDAGFDGLLNILAKNLSLGTHVPLVSTNLILPSAYDRPDFAAVTEQVAPFVIRDLVQDDQCLRVGILGLLGPDAGDLSRSNRGPAAFIGYDDSARAKDMTALVESAQDAIDELRFARDVDFVVVALHGGNPEDVELARALDGVNVIIAGHTHEAYTETLVENEVYVAQTGAHGHNLGVLELTVTSAGVTLRNPASALRPVDDSVPADPGMMGMIQSFFDGINAHLSTTGFAFDTPIFETEIDVPREADPRNALGIFVTSKIQDALDDELDEDVDLYLTGLAMIRNGIQRVDGARTLYQFSDVFQLLPLGFSEGFDPGYEVVTFYFNKWELRLLLELMSIYATFNPTYTLAYSDAISFGVRDWGIPFINRLTDLKLDGCGFWGWPSLIKIGTNRNIVDNLTKVEDITGGLVRLTPRDAAGNPAAPRRETDSKEFVLFANAMEGTVLTSVE